MQIQKILYAETQKYSYLGKKKKFLLHVLLHVLTIVITINYA